jgi:acetyl-CoA carboxylase / biotin carboxylase 1
VLQVKAERPKWYLGVISGVVLRAIGQVNIRSAEYLGYLAKGQLPPSRISVTAIRQEVVLEGGAARENVFKPCQQGLPAARAG